MDEISGTGYPRQQITWASVKTDTPWDFERLEAELIAESLRKWAELWELDA
jgi:hypothetical protein